jgi:restriction endonuclease S subunit
MTNTINGGNMMKKLNELFTINSGVVFKRLEAPPGTSGYEYKIITLKSINDLGYLEIEYFDEFKSKKEIIGKHIAQIGDIIVRLSYPYTAVNIDKEAQGAIIPSLFAILRPKGKKIISEYASIFLNSDYMKKQYNRDASGSALQMIKMSALKNYEVIIPNVERQKSIIEISKLSIKELHLIEALLEQKKLYHKGIFQELIKLEG